MNNRYFIKEQDMNQMELGSHRSGTVELFFIDPMQIGSAEHLTSDKLTEVNIFITANESNNVPLPLFEDIGG